MNLPASRPGTSTAGLVALEKDTAVISKNMPWLLPRQPRVAAAVLAFLVGRRVHFMERSSGPMFFPKLPYVGYLKKAHL